MKTNEQCLPISHGMREKFTDINVSPDFHSQDSNRKAKSKTYRLRYVFNEGNIFYFSDIVYVRPRTVFSRQCSQVAS